MSRSRVLDIIRRVDALGLEPSLVGEPVRHGLIASGGRPPAGSNLTSHENVTYSALGIVLTEPR
jgi:hypothetical protein